MMAKISLLFPALFCIIFTHSLQAQVSLEYYLPDQFQYDQQMPTPAPVIGFEVGEWHVSHDRLLQYYHRIASASDRMRLDTIGYTYERRPLVHLTVSSPENLAKLDHLRQEHVKLCDPAQSDELDLQAMPVVVWLGYSVHGNEASGGNASLLTAYHLAAAQGEQIEEMLDNMIILVDPCFNPDGFHRFSTWVNSHRSLSQVNPDPNDREHNEVWPGGRTNHYWFDLNRDWLPVQHPESKARLARFHDWKPNYLTDHHEMGSNATFFFQPGIPSRNNPITPQGTFDLTYKMAQYYADALDEIGSLYYMEESFDDFYYGKGSTYPDVNGAVGILFEQASSRGHAQNTVNGVLTFPFAIRNHFVASLATLKGTLALRTELLSHQREFFQTAIEEGRQDQREAYVFAEGKDRVKTQDFLRILLTHQIEIYTNQNDLLVDGKSFPAGASFLVPMSQPQYRMVRAIFEEVTRFEDSLFYDVSAWTLPHAYDITFASLEKKEMDSQALGQRITETASIQGNIIGGQSSYAYVFEWYESTASKALNRLLKQGLRAKVATRPFISETGKEFSYGSILIPIQNQVQSPEELFQFLQKLAQEEGIEIHSMKTGLTRGVSLGSSQFRNVKTPKVLLLVEGSVSGYEAGEAWHLLDYRQQMEVTLLPVSRLGRIPLHEYSTLVLVGGGYNELGAQEVQKIRTWLSAGGTMIAYKRALRWVKNKNLASMEFITAPPDSGQQEVAYIGERNLRGAQVIGGAICQVELDLTHPLAYGFESDKLAIFRNSTMFLEPASRRSNSPFIYTDAPLLSGYISDRNLTQLSNSAAINVHRVGRGHIIAMTDNPNFRAFWRGTNRIFLNAVFFGSIID